MKYQLTQAEREYAKQVAYATGLKVSYVCGLLEDVVDRYVARSEDWPVLTQWPNPAELSFAVPRRELYFA